MKAFLDVMRAFGPKLAVNLIQLPPSCGVHQLDALARFLKDLPKDLRFAVEFRNSTWGQQRTLDVLREHGCALVLAEYETRPARLHVTADFLYVRWIGVHERFEVLNHEQIDVTPNLEWWKGELERVVASQRVTDVWGFFNNDYSGYSIETCRKFMRLMGLPVRAELDQQSLFG
jgi:uncharacterized protein YecE (DUF72 family)